METLLDKTEKSLTKDLPLPAVEPLAQELETDEGLRIVKQALAREVWRLASKVAVFLFVFGGLAYIGLWCFNQVRSIPINFAKPVYRIDLPQQKESAATLEAPKSSLEGVKKSEVKASATAARVHVTVPHKGRAHTKTGKKKMVSRRLARAIYPGQQPAGGRIIYQDGNITEYHWH